VTVMERTNARSLTAASIGGAVDLTVVDASFIGLGKLMPAIASCTKGGGDLVALVKPQFEVGRAAATRARGVVRDGKLRAEAVASVARAVSAAGFHVAMECDSVLAGPKGNREVFLFARRSLAG
jgi:23S rRNA (cytidine1920-2'-O)/16S rRNA (cytidine1409-2'-O)-methyltransferase